MKRRSFLKKAGLAAAAGFAAPYILPQGRLFAATGTRVVNHVVLLLYAGGVRNLESVHKAEGNLMPNMLAGSEPISNDIAAGMDPLPAPLFGNALQSQGTLFKEFRFAQGAPGHFQGHTVALTGKYVSGDINFSEPSGNPTVFEYYRKHNSTNNSALNCWWVSDNIGENENLSFSSHPDYGAKYGANFFSPLNILTYANYDPINLCQTYSTSQKDKISSLRNTLNGNFNAPVGNIFPSFKNTEAERDDIRDFLNTLISEQSAGTLNNPYGLTNGVMNNDMRNAYFAERIIQRYKPELTVVNMTAVDTCHAKFTNYCNNLRKADFAAAHLWQTIQNTPGMANDTIMIIVPEHGRDQKNNSIIDSYGRYGIDHGDAMAREIFCMILGPSGKVYQNQVFNTVAGQSVDVVPTVAHILGFYNDIPSGMLPGSPLMQAFI